MSVKTFEMKLIKSTKNTHVYGDDTDNAIVSSMYIKKSGLPSKPPSVINVIIEYDIKS